MGLANTITSPEDLQALDQAELDRLLVQHETEIVQITGHMELTEDADYRRRSRQARRHLILHKDWIQRELLRRQQQRKANASEAHRAAMRQAAESRAADNAARLQRMAEANNETLRQAAIFKDEVLKHVGKETYALLWERAKQRIKAEAEGGAA